jgi:hypothetical protein
MTLLLGIHAVCVIVCGLLWAIIPWWQVVAIYCVGHALFLWIGYTVYNRSINTVREITGLDFERAHDVYVATLTGDWSKIPTEELRTKPAPEDINLRVKAMLKKGRRAKLERQVKVAIIIERAKRETTDSTSAMMDQVERDVIQDTDPETLKEMRKRGLL